MSLDPRLRRRSVSVAARPQARQDATNAELVEACFARLAAGGKLAEKTIRGYRSFCMDAVRYFRRDEGTEIPVKEWTKAQVWEYVHHAEGYCGNLRQLNFRIPVMAVCKATVWEGHLEVNEAVQSKCASCPLMRPSLGLWGRLHALAKWFGYLASIQAVAVNFLHDVVSEWYAENPKDDDGTEKKRNPTKAEMVRLVNQTANPARRAFYAASAKWGCRPNEMLMLDRYASLGLPVPGGLEEPRGFANGLPAHAPVRSFAEGSQLVYLPEKVKPNGQKARDKRTGNRWLVVDGELRPILEQYLAYWERMVKRDPTTGQPVTTRLWLNERGGPEKVNKEGDLPSDFNARWFYAQAERLGLMKPGDREDARSRWAAHCQRHFFEQLCEMAEVPGDWANHFRGDAFKDSRGSYFKPRPEQVAEKYLKLVPRVGFNPLPDAPKVRGPMTGQSETETHRAILAAEVARLQRLKNGVAMVVRVPVQTPKGVWNVPQRVAASVAYALRVSEPAAVVLVDASKKQIETVRAEEVAKVVEKALRLLA